MNVFFLLLGLPRGLSKNVVLSRLKRLVSTLRPIYPDISEIYPDFQQTYPDLNSTYPDRDENLSVRLASHELESERKKPPYRRFFLVQIVPRVNGIRFGAIPRAFVHLKVQMGTFRIACITHDTDLLPARNSLAC